MRTMIDVKLFHGVRQNGKCAFVVKVELTANDGQLYMLGSDTALHSLCDVAVDKKVSRLGIGDDGLGYARVHAAYPEHLKDIGQGEYCSIQLRPV